MKTHGQTKQQGEALFVSGVLIEPLRGCPVVLPVRGGGIETSDFLQRDQCEDLILFRLSTPKHLRGGLISAPSFWTKVIDFAWFSSLSKHRGAATSSMKMGRVSFFLQVREQVFHNALKALHKTVLQNWSVRSLTYQLSKGEMECGSRNQGMRCQK